MIKSDGGSSSYYDLPQGLKTLNDLLEWKADSQWLGDSFHLSNLMKASWRWGTKEGTDKAYDARKIMYYGARLLMKYVGKEGLNKTLQAMLDDEQFRPEGVEPLEPPPWAGKTFEQCLRDGTITAQQIGTGENLEQWQHQMRKLGYVPASSDKGCGVWFKVSTVADSPETVQSGRFCPDNRVPTWDKGVNKTPPPSLYGNPDPSPGQSKVIGSWRGVDIYDVHLWKHLLHAQKIVDDEFRRQGLDWRHL